jgi:hypothetical protein
MSADPASTSVVTASVSQTNELLANLTRLKKNVDIYTKVRLLKEKVNALEENYNDLKNNAINSRCTTQCQDLNKMMYPNSVDNFLIQLLLSSKSSAPQLLPSAPPLAEIEADDANESNANAILYPSAPPEYE